MSRVTITTNAEVGVTKNVWVIDKYLQKIVTEKLSREQGTLEMMQENIEYLAGILGRMLEAQILGGKDFRDPAVIDTILFGAETNHIIDVKILKDGQDDDIPF